MKKIVKVIGLLRLLYPSNLKKIIVLWSKFILAEEGRTNEIKNIILDHNYHTFLEVGVWKANNLISIAKRNNSVMCYGVDPYLASSFDDYKKGESMSVTSQNEYDSIYTRVLKNIDKFSNIQILRLSSSDAISNFEDASIDMVFIDAKHDYISVSQDIQLWLPKIKIGGCLSGHDYSIRFFGVIYAVNELLGYDNIQIRQDMTWFYFKDK